MTELAVHYGMTKDVVSRRVQQETKLVNTDFIIKGHFQTNVGNSSSRMIPDKDTGEYILMSNAGKGWERETSIIEKMHKNIIWGWSDGSVKLNMGAAGAAITKFANGSGIIDAMSVMIGEGISILRAECYGLRYLVALVRRYARRENTATGYEDRHAFLCIDNETCASCCVGERWSKDNGDILNILIMAMWKGHQPAFKSPVLRPVGDIRCPTILPLVSTVHL